MFAVFDQLSGSLGFSLTGLDAGPRKRGHSAARATKSEESDTTAAAMRRLTLLRYQTRAWRGMQSPRPDGIENDKSRRVLLTSTRTGPVPLRPLSVRKFPFLEVTPSWHLCFSSTDSAIRTREMLWTGSLTVLGIRSSEVPVREPWRLACQKPTTISSTACAPGTFAAPQEVGPGANRNHVVNHGTRYRFHRLEPGIVPAAGCAGQGVSGGGAAGVG